MKIIKAGTAPAPEPPFWVGTKLSCHKCGCVVELEAGDEVSIIATRNIDRANFLSYESPRVDVKCPTEKCGEVLSHTIEYHSHKEAEMA